MQIEDFKRWHWILIALVIGGLMGFCWNLTPPDEKADGRGTSALEFVGNLTRQKTSNGYTWVRQTLVYPPEERLDPTTGKMGYANYCVCSMLTFENGKYYYKIKHFTADIPFKIGGVEPKSDTYSVKDYLADTKKTFPDVVDYRYAWWAAPRMQYILWMGGAVLLIGGLWPSLVSLMIGAGFNGPKKEKKDDYDLSRFGKSKEPVKPAIPVKVGVSEAEMQKLRDLEEQLQRNVSGMQITGGVATSVATTPANAPVKALSGVSDPTKPVTSTDPEEPKEYTGEYYPVVKAHHQEETPKH